MFRETIVRITLVLGMILFTAQSAAEEPKTEPKATAEAPAETPSETPAHAPGKAKKSKKSKKSKGREIVPADSQSTSSGTLYERQAVADCLVSAGLHWEGMKHDPETGEFVIEGPKKDNVPQFYLVMGKSGIHRIETAGFKKPTLLQVKLGDKNRDMGFDGRNGLWVRQNDEQIPDRFKKLKPVPYEAREQQWDKLVESFLLSKVRRAYRAEIGTATRSAHAAIQASRQPDPQIAAEVAKLQARLAGLAQDGGKLRAELASGKITQTDYDSRSKMRQHMIHFNDLAIKAVQGLQLKRESRTAPIPSETMLAFRTIDQHWSQSKLGGAMSACRDIVLPRLATWFPQGTPAIERYAGLSLGLLGQ